MRSRSVFLAIESPRASNSQVLDVLMTVTANMSTASPSAGKRRAVDAVADQFVVAGTSFVLMILVRRELGKSAFGKYGLLINAMILLTALQTAWVGDSLTVLDRFDERIRSGLSASMLVFGVFGAACAYALSARVVTPLVAAMFALMVLLWAVEEIGRRIFMARMTFRSLLINDIVYTVGAFTTVAALWAIAGKLSLAVVVAAMLVGAIIAILCACAQLPHAELAWQRPSLRAARDLAPFAGWRAAQLSIRPLSQFAVRSLVIALVSYDAAGDLESARLFSQPAMTYVSGVASFLLPMYAKQERERGKGISIRIMTAALVLPVAAYGTIALLLHTQIAARVFDDRNAVMPIAVLGWLAIALLFAAGQPVANLLVARQQSRDVFMVRAADSALGLVCAALVIHFSSSNLAPWALALGMVVGTIWLAVLASRGTKLRADDDASSRPDALANALSPYTGEAP